MRWRLWAGVLAMAFLGNAAQARVPLTWDSTGHAVVPVLVNGKGPYPFILDTGADESAVYAWFVKSLALPKGAQGEISGATGNAAMTATRLSSLSLDGHAIEHVDADTVPDRVDGARLAGVAGVDLMMHQVIVIDLGCGTVEMFPAASAPPAIAGAGAMLIRAGSIPGGKQLTLPVTVNGAPGVAVLDSGARSSMLNTRFASVAHIDLQSAAFENGPATRGASMKSVPSRIGPVGTVRFAGITRANVVARVIDLPYLEGAGLAHVPSMTLGLDLLRGTRLTVDYASRRFWLAASSCTMKPGVRR